MNTAPNIPLPPEDNPADPEGSEGAPNPAENPSPASANDQHQQMSRNGMLWIITGVAAVALLLSVVALLVLTKAQDTQAVLPEPEPTLSRADLAALEHPNNIPPGFSEPDFPLNANPDSRLFGMSTPDNTYLAQAETTMQRRLGAVRIFRRWDEPLIDPQLEYLAQGRRNIFLSVKSLTSDGQQIPYTALINATVGTPTYEIIRQQAQDLAQYDIPIYLTYNHEADADKGWGTPAQFQQAWRRWVQILRDNGATNVRFTWIMTAYGFTQTGERDAKGYWPGPDYVDVIGLDAYNSYTCNYPSGPWVQPAELLQAPMAFAQSFPKIPVVLTEFSSVEDAADPGRKGRWFDKMRETLKRPENSQIAGVIQWGGDYTFRLDNGPSCRFAWDSSPKSIEAIQRFAADSDFGGSVLPPVRALAQPGAADVPEPDDLDDTGEITGD